MSLAAVLLLGLLSLSARADDSPAAPPQRTPPTRRPIEYSAWNLKPGEVRLGLTDLDIGLSRRVQVGSDPTLDAVGIYNLRTRLSLADSDHWGLAVDSAGHSLRLGDFAARQLRVGVRASASAGWFAAHLGTTASWLSSEGSPDLTQATSVLGAALGQERLAEAQAALDRSNVDPSGQLGTVSMRLALELRVKGPHAIVLQGGDALYRYASVGQTLETLSAVVPDELGLNGVLDQSRGGAAWGSVAWQASWRNLQLRAGLGISQLPLAWLAPTTEISWRTGGRRSQRSIDAVADATPRIDPTPPAPVPREWNDPGPTGGTGGTGGTAAADVAPLQVEQKADQPTDVRILFIEDLVEAAAWQDEPADPTVVIEYIGDEPTEQAEPAEPTVVIEYIGDEPIEPEMHAEPPVATAREYARPATPAR